MVSENNLIPDMLALLCILWHWKPAAFGRQDGFIEVSGNPENIIGLEQDRCQAYLEEVLEDSTVAIITVT